MEIHLEKMEALKKVYAEVLLNTAKEAAARVMVSERRALRFQQDLASSKDEALSMILRLKQMMDFKTNEAQIESLSQSRKIEELEAQLNEAEQIIIDQRLELKLVREELKKKKEKQQSKEQTLKEDLSSSGNTTHEVELASDPLTIRASDERPAMATNGMKPAHLMDEMPKRLGNSLASNRFSDNPELLSIVIRNKTPEQYKNGYTQRIRAFERSPLKNGAFIIDDEKDEENLTPCSPKDESMDMKKKKPESNKVTHLSYRVRENPPVKFIRRRKKKFRFGKAKKPSSKSHTHQIIKPSRPTSLSHCNSLSNEVNNVVNLMEEESLQQDKKGDEEENINKIIPKMYMKRKVKYRSTLATSLKSPPCELAEVYPPSFLLSRCNGNRDVKCDEELKTIDNEDDSKMEMTLSSSEVLKIVPEMEKSMLVKREGDDTKASEVNSSVSSQAGSDDSPLKHTFQRKRKKVPSLSNSNEIGFLGIISLKRMALEKEKGDSEPFKSSLTEESSCGSRPLLQVAHQLVSLSSKEC